MKAITLTSTRIAAVLLALPLALATTGCSSTGRLALSLGLHAHTDSSSNVGGPGAAQFTAMPQFGGRPHRRMPHPLIVETARRRQRNDLRAGTVADMKEGVSTDSFTPATNDTRNN